MPALAASAVALYPATLLSATAAPFPEWYPRGKDDRSVVTRRLKLTLTGQGGTTNTIGAAALGFSYLLQCSNLWDAQNGISYQALVDPVNNVVLLARGTDDLPFDVSSTAAYINVTGVVKAAPASP